MFKKELFWLMVVMLVGSLCMAIAPTKLYSQETTGTISGTVSDANGGVVPDVRIVLTDATTGSERTTTTTSAGVFFFAGLPVGTYQLTIERAGFKKSQTTGIQLHVNDKLDVPIVLQVGQASEVVTVSGDTLPLLQTESAEVSNLVGNTQMTNLPLNGRNFSSLVDLLPGVAPDSGTLSSAGDTNASVNGNNSNSNLYTVDGQYDEIIGANNELLIIPPVDAIEEFKILRGNYSAEFGQATGASVNIITKSGGKDFHGSLFEFLRNDAFNAKDFFDSPSSKKSELRQHEFGGTLGGPAWIPRLSDRSRTKDFFFVSFQFRRAVSGNIYTGIVPTQGQRQGILQTPCVLNQPGCDPEEAPVFGEANVPAGAIDPNAAAILNRYPNPNVDFSNGFNFRVSSPQGDHNNYEGLRWDHRFSEKGTLSVTFLQKDRTRNNLAGYWGDDSFPSVNTDRRETFKLASAKLTYVISSRTVSDFQVGYSNKAQDIHTGASSDPSLASRSGFTYTELFPRTSGSFPAVDGPDGFNGIKHTLPFVNRSDNVQFRAGISHAVGKHNFTTGYFTRLSYNGQSGGGGDNTAGHLSFTSFRNLLLGTVSGYSEDQTLNVVRGRARDFAVYIQDAYKVRPNLTLDLGLRWQYLAQVFAADDNISNFYADRYVVANTCPIVNRRVVPNVNGCDSLNGLVTPKSPGVYRALSNPHYKDFEPRIGFAWNPGQTRKLVVRGGFGIFHGRDAIAHLTDEGGLPPWDLIPSLVGPFPISSLSAYDPNTPQPPLGLRVLDKDSRNPVSYQYSFGTQYEFTSDTSLEVNYVGGRQTHLGRNRNVNQIPAAFQLAVYDSIFHNTGLDPETVRPFQDYDVISVNERSGSSRYNSLQVFLNHRLRAGLQFQTAYTFGRNISDSKNSDTQGDDYRITDAYHPQLERGLAPQDITHSLVMNFVWEIPLFRNTKGFENQILGGWHVNGITTFRTGLPKTVCLDNDYAGLADTGVCERPNLVGQPTLSKSDRTLDRYFNTDAFVASAAGTFGNAGRNVIRAPGINNWDLSVFKDFSIPWFGRHSGWAAAESAKLRFETGFFNAWNHPQFNSINTTFVPQKDAAGDPIPGSKAANSSFGRVTGDYGPRQIQFGLRLVF